MPARPKTTTAKAKATTKAKADPAPVFELDGRELWAAAARAGLADPITAKSIAVYLGVQEATLSRVLAGKRRPPVTMVAAIAKGFPTSAGRIVRVAAARQAS